MNSEPRPTWTLTLRAEPTPPGKPDVPPIIRLRSALKTLLRRHGIRCVSIGPAEPSPHVTADASERARQCRDPSDNHECDTRHANAAGDVS